MCVAAHTLGEEFKSIACSCSDYGSLLLGRSWKLLKMGRTTTVLRVAVVEGVRGACVNTA